MKNRSTLYTIIALAILVGATLFSCSLITGCAGLKNAVGANPGPPTGFEQLLYNTKTNVVTVWKTNEVPALVWSTNQIILTVTNQQNQLVTSYTNIVNSVWHTNEVVAQVQQAQYTETLKPSVAIGLQAGGTVLNTFLPGVGGLASTGIAALLGMWGYLRSQKQGVNTTAALTQEIETIRTFVQALPNGATYDGALVNFMTAHQADAGVVTQVAAALANDVSNPDAKVAAQEVINAINALKATTTPIAPVSATPA